MQQNPRKLTTHQQAVLIQVLLTFPEQQVDVRFSPSVSDARAYAQDFLTVFKAIGWKVSGPESADLPGGREAGLAVVVSEEGRGATFRLELPQRQAHQPATSAEDATSARNSPPTFAAASD